MLPVELGMSNLIGTGLPNGTRQFPLVLYIVARIERSHSLWVNFSNSARIPI